MANNAGMRLSTRIMMLVVLPLSFELILLAGIGLMQFQTEMFAKRVEKARFIANEYNSLMLNLYRAASAGLEADIGSTFNFFANVARLNEETNERLAKLEKMLDPNSADFEGLKRIKKLQKVGVDSLLEYEKSGSFESRVRRQRPLVLITFVLSEFDLLSKNAARQVEEEQQRWEKWRDFEVKALVVGIVASIVASLGLAHFVHKTVTSRLNVVMKNIDHLSEHEALEAPLEGADEIQKLDEMIRLTSLKQEEAARMKRNLINTVTHDLRAPLTSQTLFLDLLSDGHFDDAPDVLKDQARLLAMDIKRLVGLVNNLLDAEKIESNKLEVHCKPISIKSAVDSAVVSMQGLLLSGKMSVKVEMEDAEVFADKLRTSQILVNLISNAINYAPAGSTVEIRGEKKASLYLVQVIDGGAGVPEDKVPLLFQEFTQVSEESARVSGTSGLGLSICKHLVEAQKGEIGYERSLSGGACFWFSVPLDPELNLTVQSSESKA